MAPIQDIGETVSRYIEPSFPRFIAALFLVKSKPPETSVQGKSRIIRTSDQPISCGFTDYLTKLRSYVRTGQHPDVDSNGARYIDTSQFWRDSHQRLEHEVKEQRARIYALERELDGYKEAKPQDLSEKDAKRASPTTIANLRGKKRKRLTKTASQPQIEKQEVIDIAATPSIDVQGAMVSPLCGKIYWVGTDD